MSDQPITMGTRARASDWCILRTSGPRTLGLAASLASAGFEVWTPRRVERRRLPRGRKGHKEVEAAIMPTFVFARASQLTELQAIRADPSNPHPAFSLFKHLGRIPLIAEREVAALRAEEEKARLAVLKRQRHTFAPGTRVHVPEGSFAGLSGDVVDGGNGKFALVCFGGSFQVQIATFLLRTDEVQGGPSPGPEETISGIAA